LLIGKSYYVLVVCLLCSVLFMVGCSQKTAWQEELKTAGRESKYALLFIADGKSAESKAMLANLQESTQSSRGRFKIVEVNVRKEKVTLTKFLNGDLKKTPITLVIAPNGAITGALDGKITNEGLNGLMVSPKEADLLLSMQNNEVVLLCLHKGVTGELEAVKSELRSIGTNYAGKVSVFYADVTDQQEAALVRKLPAVNSKLAVLAIAPSGNIAATLEGPQINKENLLKAAQSCSSGCASCNK
jgi:hypothetical protein